MLARKDFLHSITLSCKFNLQESMSIAVKAVNATAFCLANCVAEFDSQKKTLNLRLFHNFLAHVTMQDIGRISNRKIGFVFNTD